MATTALQEFVAQMLWSKRLQLLEQKYRDPPTTRSIDAVRGLRGGAQILAVSALEVYVRDLIRELIGRLVTRTPPVTLSTLPIDMQRESTIGYLNRRTRSRVRGMQHDVRSWIGEVQRLSTLVGQGTLLPEAFGELDNNPTSESIGDAYKEIGKKNLWNDKALVSSFSLAWGSAVDSGFVCRELNSIVERRNRVAHGMDPLNISRQEVIDGAKFLLAFAPALESTTESHFLGL